MDRKSLAWLTFNVVLCLAAGLLGSIFTIPNIATWYQTLNKPTWNPPSAWFGPVWTLLFILMGIAAYYIGQSPSKLKLKKSALRFFYVHLLANILWSILFFGLKNPGLALAELVFLWFFILIIIVKFWPINKLAAYLLLPYLFWVSFAGYLNFTIWQLN